MKSLILIPISLLLSYANLSIAQTCFPSNIAATAPDSRYALNANGTVVDKKTGLMWMRCPLGETWSNGICTGSIQHYKWQSALQIAESTVFAGLSDWRLPNKKELHSIVERRCYNPAINLTAFPIVQFMKDDYDLYTWTSSPVFSPIADDNGYVRVVKLYDGADRDSYRDTTNAVWLVRGGQ
jgi:hypothetical protein